MSKTRRQHYVWKHYLEAWEHEEKICAILKEEGKIIQTSPINVAVKRDFYKIPDLNSDDIAFISSFIDRMNCPDYVKDLNFQWLKNFSLVSFVKQKLRDKAQAGDDTESAIFKLEIMSEERLHSEIENDAIPLLAELRSGRTEFWQHDKLALDFSHFIATQHLRTKRTSDLVVQGAAQAGIDSKELQDSMRKCWSIMRHLLATNISWSIYSQKSDWNLNVVRVAGGQTLITSDQPSLNLLEPKSPNDLALYYPVGPQTAVVLEHRKNDAMFDRSRPIKEEEVRALNSRMFHHAHEQAFSSDRKTLEYLSESMTNAQPPQGNGHPTGGSPMPSR